MSVPPAHFFRAEAREVLASLTHGVLVLERSQDVETVARLLRLAHTLKGAARVVGEAAVAELAHEAEEILVQARARGGYVGADRIAELLRLLDAMAARITHLENTDAGFERGAGTAAASVRVSIREITEVVEGLGEVGACIAGLDRPTAALDEAHRALLALARTFEGRTLRFEDGTPAAIGLQGELEAIGDAILRCRGALEELHSRSESELSIAQERAYGLRLVPADVLFAGLERAARDLARDLGKQVRVEFVGGDVRVDSAVHDALRDALSQLVRNAVAHGIETPATREARGKPPTGTLHLLVERRGAHARATCSDDGGGFDIDALAREASRRGVFPLRTASQLPIGELLDALRRRGISTTDEADQASGRGVGLDIVYTSASRANGRVEVRSEPGQGASVSVVVPARMQSMAALRVEAQGRACWIPADAVARSARLAPSDVTWSIDGDPSVFEERLPLVSLAGVLTGASSLDTRAPVLVVVVRAGDREAALAVDRLAGLRTIFAQPLPAELAGGPVSHTTLTPDGLPELVLDADAIVEARPARAPSPEGASFLQRPLLVVDDSPVARHVLRRTLERAGFEVEIAASAEEALDRTRARSYAALVVDVELPGMDGYALVEGLRAEAGDQAPPCVVVSTRDETEGVARAAAAGAVGYLAKGRFQPDELVTLVRRFVT